MDNSDSMGVDAEMQSGIVRSLRERMKKQPLPRLGAAAIAMFALR